jgi:isopenicillin N synthase-like dioxygenase
MKGGHQRLFCVEDQTVLYKGQTHVDEQMATYQEQTVSRKGSHKKQKQKNRTHTHTHTLSTMKQAAASPPIISLTSPSVVKEISEACSTWGGFVLVDHGLEPAFLEQVLEMGRAFFALPLEIKQHYSLQLHGAKWRGYMPRGGERSRNGTRVDAKEGLYLGDEHALDHPNQGLPTFGANVFPMEELPEMKHVILKYHEQMKQLGNRMMRILALALELEEDAIENTVTEHDPVILPRIFHYPPMILRCADPDDIQWGIGEHSDYGLWTMLLTDSPGLEFQHPTTKVWSPVPFVPHGICMNVGDVLDRLTAGRFVSPYHRARNLSSTTPRLSLPFFYDPSWTAKMKTLPIQDPDQYDTLEREERWSKTKIRCDFDGSIAYSEFLAKKVAKVFPDLIPEEHWKNLQSTSSPSTRHALVVETPDAIITQTVLELVETFYKSHQEIKESHGIRHIKAVLDHAQKAVRAHSPPLSSTQSMQVLVAALLHDVDDRKYFPTHAKYENAAQIMTDAKLSEENQAVVLQLISYVSCSENRNSVPEIVSDTESYWMLIPRWADRLEAVGKIGVVRCYQYNSEHNHPLCSENSPCPKREEEVWQLATPERFEEYDGSSSDMISHYYDKLLHVARPPPQIVRNSYLEKQAQASSKELVEVCLRYGRSGKVDEEYIRSLEAEFRE